MTERQLTGRHVALIFVTCFSVIIAVNLTLAFKAVGTFPGLETKNSYVASQSFEADRAAQNALGWEVTAQIDGDRLLLSIIDDTGPVAPDITSAIFGRATHVADDRVLTFHRSGDTLVAHTPDLTPGNWNLRLKAMAPDGTPFQRRIPLRVRP